jgi:hypothetical protein
MVVGGEEERTDKGWKQKEWEKDSWEVTSLHNRSIPRACS